MDEQTIPVGFCQCGCGQRTRLAPYSSARIGWVRGEWTKYVLGHNLRTTPRYEVDAESGCWNTLGGLTKLGYGKITHNRRTYLLHRWMYERMIGPIANGMQLHHRCHNKRCCNPAHLMAVTGTEHRRIDVAKLTADQVREIRRLNGTGVKRREIAEQFGITRDHLKLILGGRIWKDIT